MYPRLHKSLGYTALSALLLGYSALSVATQASDQTEDKPAVATFQENVVPQDLKILVILGLREDANRQVQAALTQELSGPSIWQVDAMAVAASGYVWPDADTVVAAGRTGCQLALQAAPDIPILCTLLTEEDFRSLDAIRQDSSRSSVSALVIDQPLERQRQVANRVYPSITRFTCFHGFGAGHTTADKQSTMDLITFQPTLALSVQLKEALRTYDALIATSDSRIYNASTLSTVLLTAYGYGKPVIGFSRAYVKAGALITSYSTPSQILRQVARRFRERHAQDNTKESLIYPEFFSVVDNQSVARSLGLIKDFPITLGKTYTDADFQP